MSPDEKSIPESTSGQGALAISISVAKEAGAIIRDRFLTEKKISFKGRSDIVTDVDVEVEKLVLNRVKYEYPDFSVLAEESSPIKTSSEFTWVIDPIDGTRNFAQGIPHFCVIVALAKGADVEVGVIYDPIKEDLFTAQKGMGAFLNGEPIYITSKTKISDCLLGFDLGYVDQKAGTAIDMIRYLWPGFQSMRLMGSAGLGMAYASAGRIDLYFHHSLSPWDMAAGLVLAREAGGVVVDRQGNPANLFTPSVIVANPETIKNFLSDTDGLEWRTG